MNLYELERGTTPLLIDVPHAGTYLPPEIEARLTPVARTVPDTDWHVDRLYAFARGVGATLVAATHSRYVVDLNRDPDGAALYPGADNTELCPTRTFANEPIYVDDDVPAEAEIAQRRAGFFEPYHAVLAGEIEHIRARHGHVVLLDGHSIRSEVPRFFSGRLPDLNLGTAGGASCDPALEAAIGPLLATSGLTSVVNGRFKGGYVTRHYGQPAWGVHALQLEIAQSCYMDEHPPWPWDPARAAALGEVLARLVGALAAWRPQ